MLRKGRVSERERERKKGKERERESKTAERSHTGLTVRIFYETSLPFLLRSLLLRNWYRATSRHLIILVFPQFSTFSILVLSYLKASNHFSFSSLLYFHESFPTFQLWAVWRAARAQSDVTFCSCLLVYIFSSSLCWLYNIRDAYGNSHGPTPSLLPTRCTWTHLLLASYPHNFFCTSAGKHLRPVYFKKTGLYFICLILYCPQCLIF